MRVRGPPYSPAAPPSACLRTAGHNKPPHPRVHPRVWCCARSSELFSPPARPHACCVSPRARCDPTRALTSQPRLPQSVPGARRAVPGPQPRDGPALQPRRRASGPARPPAGVRAESGATAPSPGWISAQRPARRQLPRPATREGAVGAPSSVRAAPPHPATPQALVRLRPSMVVELRPGLSRARSTTASSVRLLSRWIACEGSRGPAHVLLRVRPHTVRPDYPRAVHAALQLVGKEAPELAAFAASVRNQDFTTVLPQLQGRFARSGEYLVQVKGWGWKRRGWKGGLGAGGHRQIALAGGARVATDVRGCRSRRASRR